ncbi:MAG: hypothetical protein WD534_07825 [Phycisphaeraceae bacterium]
MSPHWPTRTLAPTDLVVGPCAWRITLLADDRQAGYVREHPSLVVVMPEDDDAVLEAAAPHVAGLPVLLIVAEPSFARRLPGQIEQRMAALGRSHVEALMLRVDEPTELKSGGLLQTLFGLRDRGAVDHLGLASHDPLAVEWLAGNTAVRLLGLPYSLADQTVRWRALARAAEYGMATISLTPPPEPPGPPESPPPRPVDEAGLRFALAEAGRVLPLLDRPLPEPWAPMPAGQAEAAWDDYRARHDEPAPLPRGRPPVGDE